MYYVTVLKPISFIVILIYKHFIINSVFPIIFSIQNYYAELLL